MEENNRELRKKICVHLAVCLAFILIAIFAIPPLFRLCLPLIVAWFIAMIANPLVRFLENKIKIMRKHGTVIVIVLVLALICAAIYGIISFIVVQTSLLIDDLPSVYESVVNNIQQAMSVLHEKINIIPADVQSMLGKKNVQLNEYILTALKSLKTSPVSTVGNVASSLIDFFVLLILTLMMTYFFVADHDKIKEEVDQKRLRKKWHLYPEEQMIIFVGRLEEIKGTHFLIRAFQLILQESPNCRLWIVGDGDYQNSFSEANPIFSKITFTGFVDQTSLFELYRLADVGVVPSLFEPFGYVPVEMMMHELPIVATATSGLNEVVDESCGLKVPLIVSPDSVEIDTSLLAQKIVYLLQNPKEAKRLGKNGRKRYLEKYSSEVFGKNMIAFYKSLFQECK